MRVLATAFVAAISLLVVAAPIWPRPPDGSIRKVPANVVWANIRHQYGKAWARLHPRYQHVTTRAFWESCQRKRERAGPDVDWHSIRVKSVYPDRIRLPLLGMTRVTAVTIRARAKYLGEMHTLSATSYWTKVEGRWRIVWGMRKYRAYANGHCPEQ